MKTVVTRSPEEAARFVREGDVAAFPTETVYGLGAAIFDAGAIRKVFEAKARPVDNPLIAHIATTDQIACVASNVPESARRFVEAFFPGPLTVVLRKHPEVPAIATAGLDTIGVRMPAHPLANTFLAACATPVVAPSANRSGRPSPTTWQAVLADLDGRIPCILAGDRTAVGLESTVVDCTIAVPLVLRPGAISVGQLATLVPGTRLVVGSDGEASRRSPGTRHRHYAPRARVVVVASPAEVAAPTGAAFIGIDSPDRPESFATVRLCRSPAEYAHELFAYFRDCDAAAIPVVYCQLVPGEGVGAAINDRIRRAAAGFFSLEV